MAASSMKNTAPTWPDDRCATCRKNGSAAGATLSMMMATDVA
jgi:hypothetical protein